MLRLKLDKKYKYLLHTLVVTVLVFLYGLYLDDIYIVMALIATVAGTFLVQYPYYKPRHFFTNNLLPVHLVVGSVLSLYYFPNLALPVKTLFVVLSGIGFYIVSLINNVFLVVEEKKETIPLYRVAVTWSQIIFIVVAIPFFAGGFKLPLISVFQALMVSASAFLFSYYQIWILGFDPDAKQVRGAEGLMLACLNAFFIFVASFSVSFFPTESFLRSLFVASVLMFTLNYLFNHLKNSVTKKSLAGSILITVFFFLLLFVFRP